ncbi:MAG: sulfite exporter TauE/SafE family protein, partial [Candidatus Parcubacteria bacterium]|nr:sulfite exporter TauE/SafE family protein [Leptolyngbyaceae cyanobacterium LF-bin-113]
LLVAIHTGLVGSSYLGELQLTSAHWLRVILLSVSVIGVFLARSRFVWSLLSLEKLYVAPSRK